VLTVATTYECNNSFTRNLIVGCVSWLRQWGWFGYTTQASLLSLHPVLVPALAAYGVVTVGAPLAWLWHAKKRWKELTIQLNERFWQHAADEPDLFVRRVLDEDAVQHRSSFLSMSFDDGLVSELACPASRLPIPRARSSSV
jgi:hypothetical protein